MGRDVRGFSLIELLIVVAVIGVLAGIAIPSLLAAVHRGKQKRTMADVRAIAVAIESYASDNDAFPEVTPQGSVSDVLGYLQPTYMHAVPRLDGWGHDVLYEADGEEYTLVSLGKDGVISGPTSGPTTDFGDDLVFSMGSFVTWPAGVQN